jgi:HEPN domain-containing protein
MPRWSRGEAEVERQVREGKLQYVTGTAANGAPLLETAQKTLDTAAALVESDARSAYVLAYDAARLACSALLAQQGMRATSDGGHVTVDLVVRAQFGDGFRPFSDLRRRRNELEYPSMPANTATQNEAEQAVKDAERLISATDGLLEQLSFFVQPESGR